MAGRRRRGARPHGRSQHFLRGAVAAQFVRQAGVRHDELVVDIGAGNGRLTAALARVARLVVAVEIDPFYARQLHGRWKNVEVVEADAATVELPSERFRVVANLPFSRTNDLLHLLLDDPQTPLTRADLIVEWGVACKRGLPWPSTVSGVLWGATYEMSVARRLPRAVFEPPPSVDAGVLVVRRRPESLIAPELAGRYRAFVAAGFRRGLRAVADHRAVSRLRLEVAQARDLDAHQWAELFTESSRVSNSQAWK